MLPRTIMVDVNLELPKQLRKDLQEDEIICPACKGLGIRKVKQSYGLHERVRRYGFEFRHESFIPCQICFNGVVRVCKHCGQPSRDRNKIRPETVCLCDGAKKERDEERRLKEAKRWEEAKKVSYEEAMQQFKILYIDSHDEYVMADELEEWMIDNLESDDPTPVIYGTYTTSLSFDIGRIMESACDNLHEEADSNIPVADVKELQKYLDDWAERHQEGTKTYWPDWKVAVIPPPMPKPEEGFKAI